MEGFFSKKKPPKKLLMGEGIHAETNDQIKSW